MRRNDPIFDVTVVTPAGVEIFVVSTHVGSDAQSAGARVLSLTFDDNERKADKLELTVENYDFVHFDDPVWKHGNVIRFRFGYVDAMGPEREAIIQKTTGLTILKVEALAKSCLLNTEVRSRSFDGMTRSQVVQQIAREYGYVDAAQVHIDDTEVVHDTIVQARLTDAQFIRRMAHQEAFEFYVDHTGFHFHPRRVEQAPSRAFVWRTDQGAGDIKSASLDEDVFAKPRRHRSRGRNPRERADIEGDGNDANHADRHVTAPMLSRAALASRVTDLASISSRPGPALFDRADFETVTTRTEVLNQGNVGTTTMSPTSETTAAGAQRHANGRYRRSQQGSVKIKMDIMGDPYVAAKTVVHVSGIGQRLSGLYYVRSCKSTIDSSGFHQSLQLSSDGHAGYGGRRGRTGTRTRARLSPALADISSRPVDPTRITDLASISSRPGADLIDVPDYETATTITRTRTFTIPNPTGREENE